MATKRTSGSLMISVIIHLVTAFIIGVYLITQTQSFKDFVGAEVLVAKPAPKPQVRKPIIKLVHRPKIPPINAVTVEQVQVQQ